MNNETEVLTKAEARSVATRRKIYAEALEWFKKKNNPERKEGKEKNWARDDDWFAMTNGMCEAIDAVKDRNDRARRRNDEKDFPEYYSFKPEQCWTKNDSYWFTRYYKRGGYEKRVSILQALADGKTKEQWYEEWKAAGKR